MSSRPSSPSIWGLHPPNLAARARFFLAMPHAGCLEPWRPPAQQMRAKWLLSNHSAASCAAKQRLPTECANPRSPG